MIQPDSHDVLCCASCGRTSGKGGGEVQPIRYLDVDWCPVCAKVCAKVRPSESGNAFVDQPSPGRMYPGRPSDPIDALHDCYVLKPKRRIRVKQARYEVQRAWSICHRGESGSAEMFCFFGWLQRHRPYFVTFRCRGDPWQTVHCWLIQYEEGKGAYRGEDGPPCWSSPSRDWVRPRSER